MTSEHHEPARRVHFGDSAAAVDSEEVEVIELDRAGYAKAVESSLRAAGLTYNQLASQARTGQFSSPRARKLWLAIGEPGCAG
jgi:hypothetical protein